MDLADAISIHRTSCPRPQPRHGGPAHGKPARDVGSFRKGDCTLPIHPRVHCRPILRLCQHLRFEIDTPDILSADCWSSLPSGCLQTLDRLHRTPADGLYPTCHGRVFCSHDVAAGLQDQYVFCRGQDVRFHRRFGTFRPLRLLNADIVSAGQRLRREKKMPTILGICAAASINWAGRGQAPLPGAWSKRCGHRVRRVKPRKT